MAKRGSTCNELSSRLRFRQGDEAVRIAVLPRLVSLHDVLQKRMPHLPRPRPLGELTSATSTMHGLWPTRVAVVRIGQERGIDTPGPSKESTRDRTNGHFELIVDDIPRARARMRENC